MWKPSRCQNNSIRLQLQIKIWGWCIHISMMPEHTAEYTDRQTNTKRQTDELLHIIKDYNCYFEIIWLWFIQMFFADMRVSLARKNTGLTYQKFAVTVTVSDIVTSQVPCSNNIWLVEPSNNSLGLQSFKCLMAVDRRLELCNSKLREKKAS